MLPRRVLLPLALATSLLALASDPVLSQVPPGGGGGGGPTPGGPGGGSGGGAAGMPSRQEIEKRIKEYLDGRPELRAEWGRLTITYKAIETDPVELLKNSGQLPPNVNPDVAAKQFLPLARPYIEKYMGEIGKLVADVEFKYKSTKLAPAEYTFGFVMQELTPVAVKIAGKTLRSPLTIPLKHQPAKDPYATLNVAMKDGKKEGELLIDVGFAKVLGTTPKLVLVK